MNRGNLLSRIGSGADALAINREAIGIFRDLAEAFPEVFGHDLALSLANRARVLLKLSRSEEAVESISEAVALRRRQAEENPMFHPHPAFEAVASQSRSAGVENGSMHGLASALNVLANAYITLDRHSEALEASHEAADLLRLLAEKSDRSFDAELATALTNLSLSSRELGKLEESLKWAQEGVSRIRPLFLTNPHVWRECMDVILRRYLETVGDLAADPDVELIEPIARTYYEFGFLSPERESPDEDVRS